MTSRLAAALFLHALLVLSVAAQSSRIDWDRDRADIAEKVRELDARIAAQDWSEVVTRAQSLIDEAEAMRRDEGLVTLQADPQADGVWYPVVEYVTRRLVSLPPEALTRYRSAYESVAAKRLASALSWRDTEALDDIARRLRATPSGQRALQLTAASALEAGHGRRAARLFEDLLETAWRAPDDDDLVRAAARGRLLAAHLSGDALPATIGARAVRREWLPPRSAPDADAAAGPTGKLEGAWATPHRGGEEATDGLVPWPHVIGSRIWYHTRTEVRALDLETGVEAWSRALDDDENVLAPLTARRTRSLRGSCDGRIYAFAGRGRNDGETRSELVVLAAHDGTLRWRCPAPEDGEGEAVWDPGPLILEDSILATVVTPGEIPSSWVVCLALADGRERWRARIGGDVPLPFRDDDGEDRPAPFWTGCSPMATEAGLVFCCDNLGTLACLEVESGRPRWCYRYPRRRIDGTGAFDTGALARGWDHEPVRVERGVVAVAPDDGDALHVLFVRPPGDAARRAANANFLRADSIPRLGMREFIGFSEGEIFLSGRSLLAVGAVVRKLTPFGRERLEPWDAPAPLDGRGRGRANLTRKRVYVCSSRYVYAVDRESGSLTPPLLSPEDRGDIELGHPIPTGRGLLIAGLDAVRLHREAVEER